jgi:hypothetical protein
MYLDDGMGGYGGAPIMYSDPMAGAAPIMDTYQQAAVMPMTQEALAPAVAPFDPSSLAGLDLSSLGGLNFSGFGGGRMGGVIDDPNIEYIPAPISNKGNPTGKMGGNVFAITPDQPVRLVDLNTKTVVFEGTGADAARKATEIGQNLTDTMGRKASYDIQTADPSGAYVTVANEKKNKSTLGTIANVAGTLLPLAMIPLTAGASAGSLLASTAGKIGLGTALGAAGAGLKGDNILKGAVMGGLSSAGGALLGGPIGDIGASNLGLRAGTAIGTGLGATAGGLATGQSLKNSLLGGVASGALSYVTPDIAKGLGIGQTPSTSTSTSGSAPSGSDIVVSATPAVTPINLNTSLGGSPNKIQQALAQRSEAPFDGITAIGNRLGGLSAVNFGGNQFGAPGEGPSALDKLTQPEPTEAVEEIDVFGNKIIRAAPVSVPVTSALPTDIVVDATKVKKPTSVSAPVTGALPTDIVVNAPKAVSKEDGLPEGSVVGGLPITGLPTMDPELTQAEKEKLGLEEYLRLAALAAGVVGGGKGGSGSSGTYVPGGRGLNPTFSAKLPTSRIPGGVGNAANLAPRKLGPQDWETYGQRPEISFYNYVPEPTGMAEGGMFAAKRGGQSRRTEFAVNGAGTGRSDDIPAVLSDGEYVIDAETVALLGDGSSKAGAKKLDELRVKVRKHKGQKLAKGRFSANAKRPEAYLSGGRI